jgi:hypothetical protein
MPNVVSQLVEFGNALAHVSRDQLPHQIKLFTALENRLSGIGLIPSQEMGVRSVNTMGSLNFMLFRTWRPLSQENFSPDYRNSALLPCIAAT